MSSNSYILLFAFFTLLISCKKRDLQEENHIIYNQGHDANGSSVCKYIFDKNSILVQNYCSNDALGTSKFIFYYPSGTIQSIEPLHDNKIHGTKIDYYESGIIKQITEYQNGVADGVIKIYYPSGYLRAINLILKDSIYYVRIYRDTFQNLDPIEEIHPIVQINNDSFKIKDSVQIKIGIPFNQQWGLDSTKYVLRYDQKPAQLLEGKRPFANYSVKVSKEEIWVGVTSSIATHNRFYCYITDKKGNIMGPTIYRDIYFVE